jgi:hypothetical protein
MQYWSILEVLTTAAAPRCAGHYVLQCILHLREAQLITAHTFSTISLYLTHTLCPIYVALALPLMDSAGIRRGCCVSLSLSLSLSVSLSQSLSVLGQLA